MTTNTSNSGRIQSVQTTLAILEVLRDRRVAGVSEIARELTYAKSTVHHYLKSLEEAGYVERKDTQYALGLQALTLGGVARERERLFHLGREQVDQLAVETGEKVRLIVERDWRGITVYQAEGEQVSQTRTHVGSTELLHSTAAGKAFLAAIPRAETHEYISQTGLPAQTENTITETDELLTELDRIKDRGIALDDQEHYTDIRCVAVPIVIDDETVLGTISASAPLDRMSEERFRSTLPNKLQNIAGVVEINTTYSEWIATS
jgi:DNA-binding IclR family transcriptional regulator